MTKYIFTFFSIWFDIFKFKNGINKRIPTSWIHIMSFSFSPHSLLSKRLSLLIDTNEIWHFTNRSLTYMCQYITITYTCLNLYSLYGYTYNLMQTTIPCRRSFLDTILYKLKRSNLCICISFNFSFHTTTKIEFICAIK